MPAVSKAQQRFFGMVRATQKGEMENPSPEVAQVAASMSKSDVNKFAKTKHKGLPMEKNVEEGLGINLAHRIDRSTPAQGFHGKKRRALSHALKMREIKKTAEKKRTFKHADSSGKSFSKFHSDATKARNKN